MQPVWQTGLSNSSRIAIPCNIAGGDFHLQPIVRAITERRHQGAGFLNGQVDRSSAKRASTPITAAADTETGTPRKPKSFPPASKAVRRRERRLGSHRTRRWREMNSNYRSRGRESLIPFGDGKHFEQLEAAATQMNLTYSTPNPDGHRSKPFRSAPMPSQIRSSGSIAADLIGTRR